MADDVYVNPFQPNNVGEGPYNGFSIGVENARRNFELAPFKGMEKQRQEMGLQKQRQQQTEFMSPEAISARTSAFPAQTAENQLKLKETQGKQAAQPFVNEKLVEEARQHLTETRGKPAGLLLQELGNASQYLKAAPDGMKKDLYEGLVKGIQSKYPGMEFPEEWKKYHIGIEEHLNALHEAQIQTPKHGQEIEKTGLTSSANIIAQRGRGVEAAALRQSEDKKNQRRIGILKQSMADPKISDEEKESMAKELETLAMPKFEEDQIKRFPEMARAYMQPEMQKSFDERSKAAKNAYLDSHGLRVKMMKDGKSFMIPRSQYSQAVKEGYTKGK